MLVNVMHEACTMMVVLDLCNVRTDKHNAGGNKHIARNFRHMKYKCTVMYFHISSTFNCEPATQRTTAKVLICFSF